MRDVMADRFFSQGDTDDLKRPEKCRAQAFLFFRCCEFSMHDPIGQAVAIGLTI
jgi:hypothetical protein